MKVAPTGERLREWISLAAAVAIGPAFLLTGYHIPGLVFGAAAGGYILLCVAVVPLLTLAAGRLKFLAWQIAIFSIALAVIGDNLRLNSIHRNEIPSAALKCSREWSTDYYSLENCSFRGISEMSVCQMCAK